MTADIDLFWFWNKTPKFGVWKFSRDKVAEMGQQETEYLSLARIACLAETPPSGVRKAAAAIGIEPAMRLNEIAYYDGPAATKIIERIWQDKRSRRK